MDKEEIGYFVADQRKRLGLSQQKLAEKAGLTRRQAVLEVEGNSTAYSVDVLIKLIRALNGQLTITTKNTDPIETTKPMFDFRNIPSATEKTLIKSKTKRNEK